MIHLFTLYERFLGKVNTHQSGHARPVRNFENWVNDISLELFEAYYKVFEKTHHISDNLTPFLRSRNVVIVSNAGTGWDLIRRPVDYERFASIRVIRQGTTACALKGCETVNCTGDYVDPDELAILQAELDGTKKEVPVDKIDNARWSALAGRITKGATFNTPKCTLYDEGFKIAPKGLGVVVMDYFRKPAKVKFNYNLVNAGTENEAIQYVEAGSVHLDWPESVMPEFLARLEIAYGGFKQNNLVLQKGMMGKADTQ